MADKERENGEDAGRDFGNEQDMPVADKFNPTLGPTEAAQDMSSLNQIIVPVGAYTDPNNPEAVSASVNLTLDKSPVEHSEDYGATALGEAGVETDTGGSGGMLSDGEQGAGSVATPVAPANEMAPAGDAGEERLAAAKDMNAGDWIAQVEGAEDQDALDDLRSLYDESGASYATVETAFDKREEDLA